MTAVLSPTRPSTTTANGEVSPTDPFRYGWREIQQAIPGGVQWERIPLTLEDILHPQVGDYRMHSDEHERFCVYLYDALTLLLASDPSAVVLHDVRVAWGDPEVKPHGPDISVILGVQQRQNWSTFDVTEAGVRPVLIIEVTSPQTRSVDLINKVDEYEQVGVPYYVIVDSWRRKKGVIRQLIGYHIHTELEEKLRQLERELKELRKSSSS